MRYSSYWETCTEISWLPIGIILLKPRIWSARYFLLTKRVPKGVGWFEEGTTKQLNVMTLSSLKGDSVATNLLILKRTWSGPHYRVPSV